MLLDYMPYVQLLHSYPVRLAERQDLIGQQITKHMHSVQNIYGIDCTAD